MRPRRIQEFQLAEEKNSCAPGRTFDIRRNDTFE